jgi:Cu(I)/Ag(I) efflux system membrane protein CusA/SilA
MRPSCGELLPMAIPTFGGMMAVVLTAPVVPVLYCAVEEWKLRVAAWRAGAE